jgi:diaminopimelate epimerase
MKLNFTKMHGLGNDFMVVNLINQSHHFNSHQIQKMADRNKGIGFDQLLLVEPPMDPETDFHFRIFNADGSEAGQCGNGMRCLARFVKEQKLTWKNRITATTKSGQVSMQIEKSGLVSVRMGLPKFEPQDLPLNREAADSYRFETPLGIADVHCVSMGNPHALMFFDDIDTLDIDVLGEYLSNHEDFPEQVNVGFIQVVDQKSIKLRVYERGVGETLACGSGACAAMVVANKYANCGQNLRVDLPGGHIFVRWHGAPKPVQMTGPATTSYQGQISI